jgi:tRNA A22 N-methylase
MMPSVNRNVIRAWPEEHNWTICKVTARYGDGIPYHLLAVDPSSHPSVSEFETDDAPDQS